MKLRTEQWLMLLNRIESEATGANVHDMKLNYMWAKDSFDGYIKWLNGEVRVKEDLAQAWFNEGCGRLRMLGENPEDFTID